MNKSSLIASIGSALIAGSLMLAGPAAAAGAGGHDRPRSLENSRQMSVAAGPAADTATQAGTAPL